MPREDPFWVPDGSKQAATVKEAQVFEDRPQEKEIHPECSCISRPAMQFFGRVYFKLGKLVGQKPVHAIIIVTFVLLGCMPGLFFLKGDATVLFLKINTNFLEQFAFIGTRYYDDYQKATGMPEDGGKKHTGYFPPERSNALIYTPKAIRSGSPDITDERFFMDTFEIEHHIMNELSVEYEGETYTFEDVCVRNDHNEKCTVSSVMGFVGHDTEKLDSFMQNASSQGATPLYALLSEMPQEQRPIFRMLVGVPAGKEQNLPVRGDPVLDQEWLAGASALQSLFLLREIDAAPMFEKKIQDYLENLNTGHTKVSMLLGMSLGSECANITMSALWLVGLTIMVMLGYAICFLSTQARKEGETQIVLAACSTIIPGLAGFGSFGIMGYVGLDLNVLSLLVPFLALACGLDADFVMCSAVKAVGPDELDIPTIIAKALEEGGTAITVTSVTSVLAFSMAVLTSFNLPGFVGFNANLVFALVLNWIGDMVMLPAMHALNERRMAANRLDLMPWKKRKEGTKLSSKMVDPGRFIRNFMVNRYAPLAERSMTFRIIGTILLLGLTATGIVLFPAVKRGMPDRYFVTDDSYVNDFFDDIEASFGNRALADVGMLIEKPDLNNTKFWSGMVALHDDLAARNDVAFIDCWPLMAMKAGVLTNDLSMLGFLQSSPALHRDVVVKDGKVDAARCHVYLWQNMEPDKRSTQCDEIVAFADRSGDVHITLYHVSFPIHVSRYHLVKEQTLFTCGVAVGAVFISLLLFLPVHLAALSLLNVTCVLLTLFGYLAVAGITFNAVSYTTCVMAIGFCVDYTCHVVHFSVHHKPVSQSWSVRMHRSLKTCGYDVLHGCATAFIGVVLLGFANSMAFRMFSLMAIVITGIGGLFALLGLPAMMSLTSPRYKATQTVSLVTPVSPVSPVIPVAPSTQ